MDTYEQLRDVVVPLLEPLGLELVDVELLGSGRATTLRLSIDREGGVDLEAITDATRAVSPVLDEVEVVPGSYTLEVSSPGVERPLRTPRDFLRVVGQMVSVKTHVEVDGERRHRGVLVEADDDGLAVEADGVQRRFRYDEVSQARTVLEWGPQPKPGGPRRPASKREVR